MSKKLRLYVKKVPDYASNIKYTLIINCEMDRNKNVEAISEFEMGRLKSAGINVEEMAVDIKKASSCVSKIGYILKVKCEMDWNEDVAGHSGQGYYSNSKSDMIDENPTALTLTTVIYRNEMERLESVGLNIKELKVKVTSVFPEVKEEHMAAAIKLKAINDSKYE